MSATEPVQAESPPANVIAALARVMAELPGIGKDAEYNASGTRYNYRSIEAITAAAQHLLGRYGVVWVPRVESRTTHGFEVNGRPWTEEQMAVTYRVYGPGGPTDFIEVGPLHGLGRDNADKGTNKAMTQVFKQALQQVLCIGDSKDDGDSERAEADARPKTDDLEAWCVENGWTSKAEHDAWRQGIRAKLAEQEPEVQRRFREFRQQHEYEWNRLAPADLAVDLDNKLDELAEKSREEPPASSPTREPEGPATTDIGGSLPQTGDSEKTRGEMPTGRHTTETEAPNTTDGDEPLGFPVTHDAHAQRLRQADTEEAARAKAELAARVEAVAEKAGKAVDPQWKQDVQREGPTLGFEEDVAAVLNEATDEEKRVAHERAKEFKTRTALEAELRRLGYRPEGGTAFKQRQLAAALVLDARRGGGDHDPPS